MSKPLRIGIAGLGTVGSGVLGLINNNADLIVARAGRSIEVAAVCARNKKRKRDIDVGSYKWMDAQDLARAPGLDAVVEVIGGQDGPAKDFIETTLKNKKHVITANKALLAHHGLALARLAESNGVSLRYEAAVAAGIPIIKTLREGYASNVINGVYGILNGTSNFILTEMRETGGTFKDVLRSAQSKGYAEADPSFDIDGIDAAHKLTLLAALAYGIQPDLKAVNVQGIRRITARDIRFAEELGYRIKLLGIARRQDGRIMQSVEPCLVPRDSALGTVDGVFNAVFTEGDFTGEAMAVGLGAGAGPTASAVVADLIDLARGGPNIPTFGIPLKSLVKAPRVKDKDILDTYYLHLIVIDRPGVIADITAILRDKSISIEAFLQRGRDPDQPVSVVIVTHETPRAAMRAAVRDIMAVKTVVEEPTLLRIEQIQATP